MDTARIQDIFEAYFEKYKKPERPHGLVRLLDRVYTGRSFEINLTKCPLGARFKISTTADRGDHGLGCFPGQSGPAGSRAWAGFRAGGFFDRACSRRAACRLCPAFAHGCPALRFSWLSARALKRAGNSGPLRLYPDQHGRRIFSLRMNPYA